MEIGRDRARWAHLIALATRIAQFRVDLGEEFSRGLLLLTLIFHHKLTEIPKRLFRRRLIGKHRHVYRAEATRSYFLGDFQCESMVSIMS